VSHVYMSVLCVRGAELIMCAAHVSLLQQRPDDELIMPARTHASGRVLSCVVCCRVLSCVVVCCRVLSCVVVCCRVLSCVVVCCRVLSCVVVGADATTTLFCQLHCYCSAH
jgi:hypothetical protein